MKPESCSNYDVVIIGGGAAGLMAAIAAAENGAETILLEHMDRVGKKLLSTGNGKCNYTNKMQGVSYYRGEYPAFVVPIFQQFGQRETVDFFQSIGICPKIKNGYYYPASGQASAVLDVLRMEADYRKVRIETNCILSEIKRKGNGFLLSANKGTFYGKSVIFATGLLAAPKTGSDGSAIPFIKAFGHHFIDVVPALVALLGKQDFFKILAGIRTEILIKLYINDRLIDSDRGELQLTEYGISGIPVFQVSRYAAKALYKKYPVHALLDFMPGHTSEETAALLKERFYQNSHGKTSCECLIGLFHKKLGEVLLKETGICLHSAAEKVSQKQLSLLVRKIKGLRVDIIGTKSFGQAQVCAGGVDTREIHNVTLESRLVPGVFFAGEVIDIDGMCGGYNLQWAWSSGCVAGMHAAARCKETATK